MCNGEINDFSYWKELPTNDNRGQFYPNLKFATLEEELACQPKGIEKYLEDKKVEEEKNLTKRQQGRNRLFSKKNEKILNFLKKYSPKADIKKDLFSNEDLLIESGVNLLDHPIYKDDNGDPSRVPIYGKSPLPSSPLSFFNPPL